MSHRSRERKREERVEVRAAVQAARARHSERTAVKYWLRHVKRDCRCVACGGLLRRGAEMVYRHGGRVTLCVSCADADPLISYAPSAAWEARRRVQVRRRAERAAARAAWMREPDRGDSGSA